MVIELAGQWYWIGGAAGAALAICY